MWGLYGYDVPIASVVNIGPGRPDEVGTKHFTRWRKSIFEDDPRLISFEQMISGESSTKNEKALAMEILYNDLEASIRCRLKEIYPQETLSYHRLALDYCYPGAAQNDCKLTRQTHKLTMEYLGQEEIKTEMREIAKYLS